MSKRPFISALFYTIRPSACAGIALFATASLGQWDDLSISFLTFFAAFIGSSGCFLINDIFDREKDLKNNKLRPIATGEIPVRTAFIISIACCLIMLVASTFLSLKTLVLAIVLIACFWSYSYINKHFGLLANIWVSTCSALAFSFGALVYGLSPLVYVAMFCTFFVNIGREIMLDSLDEAGDRAVGKPSIILRYGKKGTKTLLSIFFVLGSVPLLIYFYYYHIVLPYVVLLLLLLWIPFLMKRKQEFNKWALFNIRASHLFFIALILLLFFNPVKQQKMQQPINSEYCLNKLIELQSKQNGFYPIGTFPTQRSWISKDRDDDNNVFITATIAYILRTTNNRLPNERAQSAYKLAIRSFENYRNRHGEPTYNFWQTVGKDLPFPNSLFLSRASIRLPDDYDETAMIQLARGSNSLDEAVRYKMLEYAMRPNRKIVEDFPSSQHRSKKVYEVWYADKMQQELDIVVMANVLLFVMEKGYTLDTPDLNTIDCLKSSINEEWYFKKPKGLGYSPHYNQAAIILYCLTRLVEKDHTNSFAIQRKLLIKHLYKALENTNQSIEKVLLATSLMRLGEPVDMELGRDKVMKDVQSYLFFCHNPIINFHLPRAFYWNWYSEAISWAFLYEFFSFKPTVRFK